MSLKLKDKRVFIVEDHVGNMAVMMTILEAHGAVVKHDRWGKESVDKLIKFAPVDIILLDLMISQQISGYDIFDQIRSQSDFDSIPIVAVSASEASVAIPKTRTKGFAGYIAKPINIDRFPHQIAQILEGENVWDNGTILTRKG